ncbi:hypothetical protein ABPG75_011220 [Micractinium tetrahymenae]
MGAAATPAATLDGTPDFRQPWPGERFFYGGLSCVIAAAITNPMDLAKIRLQIFDELQAASAGSAAAAAGAQTAGAARSAAAAGAGSGGARGIAASAASAATAAVARQGRPGLAATLAAVVRDEGPTGLMRGVTPSMLREASYSTIRYGAYEPIKNMLQSSSTSSSGSASGVQAAAAGQAALPLWKKVVAGGVAGALGAAGATPSDLIKAARHIYLNEGGLPGLYRGVWPTTVRAAILTASQLPVYDHTKHLLLSHPATAGHVKEGPGLHFVCSMVAGFACAFTTAPVDIVKTRYMNQQFCGQGRPQRYASMAHCFSQAVRTGGVLSLWAGFLPSWIRLGPHTCISLLVFEQLRQQAGLAPI